MKTMTDEEFMEWAKSLKPCKYCGENFFGPVCPCEEDSDEQEDD